MMSPSISEMEFRIHRMIQIMSELRNANKYLYIIDDAINIRMRITDLIERIDFVIWL